MSRRSTRGPSLTSLVRGCCVSPAASAEGRFLAGLEPHLHRVKRISGWSALRPLAVAVDQPFGDAFADKMRDVAAQRADFLDESRRDELVAVGGHQKHGLDPVIEACVHPGHLEFVFEIRHGAQPADDDVGARRLGKAHQQRLESAHLDTLGGGAVERLGDVVAHDLDPLVGREQRPLAVVAGDADDEVVDDLRRAANDVEMAVGDRIEGAGVDPHPRLTHLPFPSSLSGSPASSSPSPATSGRRATDTTCSPSPTRKITTPTLPRRAMRMSLTGQRITMPPSVTSMIWSLGPTEKTATSASLRRVRSMLLMPWPPRRCARRGLFGGPERPDH